MSDHERASGSTAGDGSGGDSPTRSAAFTRAHAAALQELLRQPRARPWRQEALLTVALILITTCAVMMGGTWLSIVETPRLHARWSPLLLLLIAQIAGVYAAIAPGRTTLRIGAGTLAAAAAIAVLVGRGQGPATVNSAFACSASHLAVDLIPLALVLHSLRRFSVTLGRSILAGAAAATTGAIAGELSCGRDWRHVLVHHLGMGLVIVVACVLGSRLLRPRSFAP